nr:glutaredoxin [Bactrocera oleae]
MAVFIRHIASNLDFQQLLIACRDAPLNTSKFREIYVDVNSSCMGSIISALPRKSPINVNMTSPQADMVRDIIGSNKVVIFSKSYCPYCTMAKEQFRKLSIDAHVVELDSRNDAEEIQNILEEITGCRTVPRCFINGKFIGGGTDVKKMYEQGTLQKFFT